MVKAHVLLIWNSLFIKRRKETPHLLRQRVNGISQPCRTFPRLTYHDPTGSVKSWWTGERREERETGRREAEKGERRQTKRRKAGEEKKPRTGALAGRCTPWPRALRLGVEVGKPVGLVWPPGPPSQRFSGYLMSPFLPRDVFVSRMFTLAHWPYTSSLHISVAM